jgi:NADH-quinone oxidoreductase subunit G
VLLGNFAQQHPQAAAIHAAAQALGVRLGFLGEAANSVGGYVAGLPSGGGLPAVLEKAALLLLNVEPALDCADPGAASRARFVVNLSAWKSDVGDVLLPVAPFTETAGTFISTEGRVQSFQACALPLGEARPAWKVLRVLGTMLGRPGFEFDTIEQVRAACLGGRDVATLLSNAIDVQVQPAPRPAGIERIAEVPIYFADPLVRRAPSLQKTRDARPPRAWMNARLMAKLGVADGQPVRVRQGERSARLAAALDDRLPDDCARIAAAHASTAPLGPMFGAVAIESVGAEKAA